MGKYPSKIRNKHCQRVPKQHIVFHNKWQKISHYLFCHNRKNIFSLLQPMHYIPSRCLSQDNVLSRPGLFPYFLSHVSTIVQLKMVNCQSKRIKKSFDKVLSAIRRGKRPALYLNPNPIKGRCGLNVSTTPIIAMGCQQCLSLSVVQLKGKHCRIPYCCNGVVDTFGPYHHDVDNLNAARHVPVCLSKSNEVFYTILN